MRKFKLITIVICFFLLISCGSITKSKTSGSMFGGSSFGKTEEKVWEKPGLEIIGNQILCWNYDETEEGVEYTIKMDNRVVTTTTDEYYPLDVSDFNTHKIKVSKKIGNIEYVSEEVEYVKSSVSEKIISSVEELVETSTLGSLKADHYIFDFSQTTESKIKMQSTIYTNESLSCLTIKGNGSLSLENFKLSIGERKRDLVLIFDNIVISGYSKSMFEYSGTSSFTTDIICKNKTSFLNTYEGNSGVNGTGASGFASASNGTAGGDGGSIFSLANINMFTSENPTFITGSGGRGGNGGIGQGLAHGGYGGNGGNGGNIFSTGTIKCFNAQYKALSGSFGSGGSGGTGGTGISGKRSNGSKGRDGGITGSNAKITYKSSTSKSVTIDGTFEICLFENYLVWNEQTDVAGYEVYLGDKLIKENQLNCVYLTDSMLVSAKNKSIVVKANKKNGEVLTSSTLSYEELELANISVIPEKSLILRNEKAYEIDAQDLKNTTKLIVESTVSYVLIKSMSTETVDLNLNIVAGDRIKSLAIVLDNVTIAGVENTATISLNDGTGSSAETDPMLMLGLYNNAKVIGKKGIDGEKGASGGFFQQGGKGGNGGEGYAAVSSSSVVIFGDAGIIQAGAGGNGGDGGYASTNDIGDGGNGGNGGTAVTCNKVYIVVEDNATIHIYGGNGGGKGKRGDGTFAFGETESKDGSIGQPSSGQIRTINGKINTKK